jgi:hypothetical protein
LRVNKAVDFYLIVAPIESEHFVTLFIKDIAVLEFLIIVDPKNLNLDIFFVAIYIVRVVFLFGLIIFIFLLLTEEVVKAVFVLTEFLKVLLFLHNI